MGALDLSLGGLFIGVILNVLLFGFSCVQIYLYQARFRHDSWKIKTIAYSVFLFDFCNSLFDVIFLYRLLVTHFGNFVAANTSDIFFALDPVMTGLIAFICQSFFAWRVRRLTHTWWIPAIIIVAGGASFVCALATTIGVVRVVFYDQLQRIKVVVIIWLTGAALADTVITAALIYTLNKSRTGFPATDDVLTKLIRATLQTGLLTSTFAIIDLILYLASTSTLHLVFNLPLAKLYCNTLLSSLNARAMIPVTEAYSSEMHSTRHSAYRPHHLSGGVGMHSHMSQTRSGGIMSGVGIGGGGAGDAGDLETESRHLGDTTSKSSLPFRADSAPSLGYNETRSLSGGTALSQQGGGAQGQHPLGLDRDMEKHSEGESSPVSFQHVPNNRGVHVLTVEERYEERHRDEDLS
ncbi:hypothetical protein OC834_004611 [Tilletia horrida]|nr:hypothetical protein OC834_004611 [Tilletia horrida]KAK0530443.1 hypothetical protein OC835_004011 [Tilletia horrida]